MDADAAKYIPHDLLVDFEEFLRLSHVREQFVNDRPQLKAFITSVYRGDWEHTYRVCLEGATAPGEFRFGKDY